MSDGAKIGIGIGIGIAVALLMAGAVFVWYRRRTRAAMAMGAARAAMGAAPTANGSGGGYTHLGGYKPELEGNGLHEMGEHDMAEMEDPRAVGHASAAASTRQAPVEMYAGPWQAPAVPHETVRYG